MDERDIFDEEFDRLNSQPDDTTDPFGSWSSYNVQPPVQPTQRKPLKIVLIAILMVVCIAIGWVLAVMTNDKAPTTDSDDTRKDLLNQVIDHMDINFYEEITDEEWQQAVEQAGSALMQYAGDQFSFLMSPQTYYNYINDVGNTLTAASSLNELFGMTYSMDTKGMLISSVMADSVSYGKLQAGDMVVKMSNIKEYVPIDPYGKVLDWQTDLLYTDKTTGALLVQRNADGTPTCRNASADLILEGGTTSQVGAYLSLVYSATFHVLRDGKIEQFDLTRNKVGIPYDENNVNPNKRYDFKYVEYYFGNDVTNISTVPYNGAGASTYQLRGLDNMPADTGYVRLVQFDELSDGDGNIITSCYKELKFALQLFKKSNLKYLVLDLKGNPGGLVDLTANIAGMLIHPNNLSAEQKTQVETKAGIFDTSKQSQYLITTLVYRDGREYTYKAVSSYYNYFPQTELANGKKRIIVWTDGSSASASELLTGALLDYGTAVHMGTNTYGKGIAQTIKPLDITGSYVDVNGKLHTDGKWAVYYTCANYYSPFGTNIQGVGYNPAEANQASTYKDLWELANNYWN